MEVARLAGLAGRRLARAGCAAWRSARQRVPGRLQSGATHNDDHGPVATCPRKLCITHARWSLTPHGDLAELGRLFGKRNLADHRHG